QQADVLRGDEAHQLAPGSALASRVLGPVAFLRRLPPRGVRPKGGREARLVKAVLVCHQVPKPVGHGGHRRAYQIRRELQDALGEENVLVADNLWNYYPGPGWRNLPFRLRRSVSPYLENPLNLVARTQVA